LLLGPCAGCCRPAAHSVQSGACLNFRCCIQALDRISCWCGVAHKKGKPLQQGQARAEEHLAAAAATQLSIQVCTGLTGEQLCIVRTLSSQSVGTIKSQIEGITGIRPKEQRLLSGERLLEDSDSLCDHPNLHGPDAAINLVRVEFIPQGDCPACEMADLELRQELQTDKRGTWCESHQECPLCGFTGSWTHSHPLAWGM